MRFSALVFLVACSSGAPTDSDDGPGVEPVCDGIQQLEEPGLDSPFDQDGDGFFDGNNPDCVNAWQPSQLDCDDTNPDVNPTKIELPCNGLDDDCREASEDNRDQDGDGVGVCEDCNDAAAAAYPGAEEECFDSIDNDCDGIIDNDCGDDYTGTWTVLSHAPMDECESLFGPAIDLDMSEFFVTYFPPAITLSPTNGTHPTAMDGEVGEDGTLSLTSRSGAQPDCVGNFAIEGTFLTADSFEGTFTYSFNSAVGLCGNCGRPSQSFHITAYR